MKYCTNCGTKIEDGAKFCQKCGVKVTSSKKYFDTINKRLELENNQQPIIRKSLIAAIIFAILMILPFMEWSPITGAWALAFISFFLFLCSLIIAWMFRSRSEKLKTLISGKNLLAEWKLSPKQKESYINYLYKQERDSGIVILLSISFVAIIVFGIFILFIDEGKLFMLGLLVGLILFLSFFALVMPLYYRNSNKKEDGLILIGAKYAYINGYFHNWDFPLSGLSRIKIIKEPFYGINLVYYYTDRTLKHNEEIFIPANKDLDLTELVEKMKTMNPKRRKRKNRKKRENK